VFEIQSEYLRQVRQTLTQLDMKKTTKLRSPSVGVPADMRACATYITKLSN